MLLDIIKPSDQTFVDHAPRYIRGIRLYSLHFKVLFYFLYVEFLFSNLHSFMGIEIFMKILVLENLSKEQLIFLQINKKNKIPILNSHKKEKV